MKPRHHWGDEGDSNLAQELLELIATYFEFLFFHSRVEKVRVSVLLFL